MKTENLVLLAIAGIAAYFIFFKKDGLMDWGSGGGGGSSGYGSYENQPTAPPAAPAASSSLFSPQMATSPILKLPINIVANVPVGVVSGSTGHVEGLLIKGKTSALFINPGSQQVAKFMNAAIAGGKTFPLNQKPSALVQGKGAYKKPGGM
jgi:hypothetical protein